MKLIKFSLVPLLVSTFFLSGCGANAEGILLKEKLVWVTGFDNDEDFYKPCMVISGQYLGSVIPSLANYNSFTCSESKSDIKSVISYLNNVRIVKDGKRIEPGAGNRTLTIVTPTKMSGPQDYDYYTFSATSGVTVLYGEEYSLTQDFPRFTDAKPYGYSFMKTALLMFEMSVRDLKEDTDTTRYFPYLNQLEKMIFKPLDDIGFGDEINDYNRYKIQNSLGFIIFENEKVFRVSPKDGTGGTYEIVNYKEVNFSSLRNGPVEG